MTTAAVNAGGNFLTHRNEMSNSKSGMASLKDVVIVEDETIDADQLRAILNLMFGYGLKIRRATTLGGALDCLIEKTPDVVFLDDYLKPSDNASVTIPFLRRTGFTGPIIVVSSEMTRQRGALLTRVGADYIIHKDDINSARIAEALAKVMLGPGATSDVVKSSAP